MEPRAAAVAATWAGARDIISAGRSPEPRIPQMVRARCNSPALALETMPWKYPPGLRREVGWRFPGDNRDGDRGLLTPHGEAGVAPDEFGNPHFVAEPVGGIHDLGPAGRLAVEVWLQPRCELDQLHRRDLEKGTRVGSHFAWSLLRARRLIIDGTTSEVVCPRVFRGRNPRRTTFP